MDISSIEESKRSLAVNTIKMMSVDAVESANSGHPGLPMGCSDIAFVLWMNFLKFNPANPNWANRDRFVLSAGHGSALNYSLLHLFGYDLPIEEVKNFRQFNSKTPGHPEYGHTAGIETTTGPLGQGFANSVGMAISERVLAGKFNNNGKNIIDHYIYGIAGDGDMMEGITSEAASIAGHLGLSKLIYIYDSNSITIEGKTDLAFTEDVKARFLAYNWHVIEIDGHNHLEIEQALTDSKAETEKPSLIIAKTHIGKGSPNRQDTAKAHGEPLGADELKATKNALNWPADKTFLIPEDAKKLFEKRVEELVPKYDKWQTDFESLVGSNKEFRVLWDGHHSKKIPDNLEELMLKTIKKDSIATRSASGDMMQVIADKIPAFIGGSADLAPSNKTFLNSFDSISKKDFNGKNLHFGIREHAMGAIINGMALDCLIPFASTFLVFSDYMRPSIRLAALMNIQSIFIFTHDSIFVGEDGPTHQPIEQTASLRLIPNVQVIRPADATECASAWIAALAKTDGPTILILSRQNLPVLDRSKYASQSNLKKGAYTLAEPVGDADILILASGSEVSLALSAADELGKSDIKTKIVSIPSFELFKKESDEYKKSIFGNIAKVVAIEAGSPASWYEFVDRDALIIGIDKFGQSAPAKDVANAYGFTPEKVVQTIKERWEL